MPPTMRGAVDLGALAAAREQQEQAQQRNAQRNAQPEEVGSVKVVTELTEQNFQPDGIDRSFEVPVVVVMWSPRSEVSVSTIQTMQELAVADGGTWLVAAVNVDAEQQIAAAFQVEGVPSLIALIKGQPVPLVQGAIALADARALIDQVIQAAEANGVAGRVQLAEATPDDGSADNPAADAPAPEQVDPLEAYFDAAADAYDRQDWDAVAAAYNSVLAIAPDDSDAKAGLVRVELMQQLDGKDFAEVLAQADAAPSRVDLAIDAANVELLSGVPAAAFDRLITVVRDTQDDDRVAAREHLVKLFDIIGQTPEVAAGRTKLANALF